MAAQRKPKPILLTTMPLNGGRFEARRRRYETRGLVTHEGRMRLAVDVMALRPDGDTWFVLRRVHLVHSGVGAAIQRARVEREAKEAMGEEP